jgi:hypothetical protein
MAKGTPLTDEEVAVKIVELYFEEIARMDLKRSLDLDDAINAYYYTLYRLGRKDFELKEAEKSVIKEEKKIVTETKEEIVPAAALKTTTTTTTTEIKK